MKQYKQRLIEYTDMRWAESDPSFKRLPAWSCYCILEESDDFREALKVATAHSGNYFVAYRACENCEGRGYMPIPPSEVGII